MDFNTTVLDNNYEETVDNCNSALGYVVLQIFLKNAIAKQKRILQRFVKKPKSMTSLLFYSRLVQNNNLLSKFPNGTPMSPLPADEIKEIFEFALPVNWRQQMILARFDPTEQPIKEVLDFCKDIEGIEAEHGDLSIADNPMIHASGKPKAKPRALFPKSTSNKKRKFRSFEPCPIHPNSNPPHSRDECEVLKSMIAEKRAEYSNKRSYKNVKRNNAYAKRPVKFDKFKQKQQNQQQLNVLITEAVNKRFAEVKAESQAKKKRKVTTTESEDVCIPCEEVDTELEAFSNFSLESNTDDGVDESGDSSNTYRDTIEVDTVASESTGDSEES